MAGFVEVGGIEGDGFWFAVCDWFEVMFWVWRVQVQDLLSYWDMSALAHVLCTQWVGVVLHW